MALEPYQQKRDFKKTPEPKGRVREKDTHLYLIQKHAASHLHYDFRLELDGVLKSWAVPKGPSLDPAIKRLAMHVEDHPIEYGSFEGIIPKGEYGGGTVMLWDTGHWISLDQDPRKAYEKGHLHFKLDAEKLHGEWHLIRFKKDEKAWLLMKQQDDFASKSYDILTEKPNSVVSQQTLEEIAEQPMPNFFKPQLACLVGKAPRGDLWLHEIKLDGYRILAFKNEEQITLFSRNGLDWTKDFPNIADSLKKLTVKRAIFDGEVVVFDKQHHSNFQLLQNSIKLGKKGNFIYYLFDLLYYENMDTRHLPLLKRKELLQRSVNKEFSSLHVGDYLIGHGEEVFKQACHAHLEGIVSKKIESTYISKRSKSWLKVKCIKRQEFVIGAFTQPQGSRDYFGALYLGVYDEERHLIYTGNVGTGFTQTSLKLIYEALKKNQQTECPFWHLPRGIKKASWVNPILVAEIEFTEWTEDGRLRHPSFKGLRADKKATEIRREDES